MAHILYTFRRCPYAIRARMALCYAQVAFEQHEVDLKNKPSNLIKVSSKGTVPVLILESGQILDESVDIIRWALKQSDPDGWWRSELEIQCDNLIQMNDTHFKPLLDNYKYPQRSEQKEPTYYRAKAQVYLEQLESLLIKKNFLVANHITYADVALFPFIRQFYMVDQQWFIKSDYQFLKQWLEYFLSTELFVQIMEKQQN